ncbi:MAG: PE-PGRS family protein, partial [Myxococcota bacterium]
MDPCAEGCAEGTLDADGNPATGTCGCEHSCALDGCPQDLHDVDGNPLTGTCGCEYQCTQTASSDDPIDPDFTDDNCDGSDGLVEQCVYVSASQGSDLGGDGTRFSPLQTIAGAIQHAQAHGVPAVCLSGEVYNEAVTLVSGISLYGGFDPNDPDFRFRRSANAVTTITAPALVVDAPQVDVDTHVEGVTLSALAPAVDGASTYGVRLGGGTGTLYVRYNVVTAAGGRTGARGNDGQPHVNFALGGANGVNGCTGTGCGLGANAPACTEPGGKGGNGGYNNGSGQPGSPGSGNANGGGAGTSSGVCSTPSGGGGRGTDGAPGTAGNPGNGGAPLGTVGNGYLAANGGNGGAGTNGRGGGGGGGGGGGAS